jgi:hypothetical protein
MIGAIISHDRGEQRPGFRVSGLAADDPHHWGPVPGLSDWLIGRLPAEARVLELGPGYIPWPRANVLVDCVDVKLREGQEFFKLDVTKDPLPFPDKSFDFVYCRQMVEDLYDPFTVCKEMSRVGKAGYIETPSPIAEICPGVDGQAPPWRGYYHHRYVIWEDAGVLNFVAKFPLIEHLNAPDASLAEALRLGPRYWNTYHLWDGEIRLKHHQAPLDFDLYQGYAPLLSSACMHAAKATDRFFEQITTTAQAA